MKSVLSTLGEGPFIVRSSSHNEDSLNNLTLGLTSVINVTKQNLESAIKEVISSYGEPSNADEVLVQLARMSIFLVSH